ncbi:MAG: type I 3-dehydroquinate dehydratase [Lachnospiraceae bacterium]|nr:type I 3-dehydroquinate dehydratase [Lachnospiraceae bacterium]
MEKKIVRIRDTKIGAGRPKICVPLVAADETELEEALGRLEGTPFDLVEWRADFYREAKQAAAMEDALERIRERLQDKPLLFTFRTQEEGGAQSIEPAAYFVLNERAAKSGMVDIVDVELNRGEELAERLVQAIHRENCCVLGSFHDFSQTPSAERMTRVLQRMQQLDMDITKLAVMPRTRRDVLELLAAAVRMEEELADRPCVTMSMGSLGVISRVAGSFSGSAITFGTAGSSSAPGQIPAGKLEQILRILSESIEEK